MKGKTVLLGLTAIVLVSGCNRGAGNTATPANSVAANSSAAAPVAPATPAPAANGAVDQAFLVGHWSDSAACTRTISFNADGTAAATGEDDAVRWALEGTTLSTTEGDDQPERATVGRNGDMLTVTPERGQAMQLTRCAAPVAGPAANPGSATDAAPPAE